MPKRSLAIALLLLGVVAVLAQAGVPKVVVLENFGATW